MQEIVDVIVRANNEASKPMRELASEMRATAKPAIELRQKLMQACKIDGFKGLVSDLKKVQREIVKVGKETKAAFGKTVLGGAALLGGSAFAFKALFIDVAAEQERYISMLTTLTGSQEKAKQSMAWINTFAQKTPYELSEVTQAFIKMKSLGIDPQSGGLERIGDAAAMTKMSLEDMITAYSKGSRGNFEILVDRGIVIDRQDAKKGGVDYNVLRYKDKDGTEKSIAAAKGDVKAHQEMIDKIFAAKNYTGGMDKLSQTWDGKVLALLDTWAAFRRKIMDSGPFKELHKLMDDTLGKIGEMFDSGEIDKIADEWGKYIVSGIKDAKDWLQNVAVPWFKEDFLPTFREIKDFFGGWGNTIAAAIGLVAAIIMGPLISAVVTLGVAIMSTPVGWILGAIVAIGAGIYLLVKHWNGIKSKIIECIPWLKLPLTIIEAVFGGIWRYIKNALAEVYAAFQSSWLDGIVAMLKNFTPLGWLVQACSGMVGFFSDLGAGIVKSIKSGIANAWSGFIKWFKDKAAGMLDVLPDWARSGLNKLGGMLSDAGRPAPGAGKVLRSGQASPFGQSGKYAASLEQNVKTEVVIRAENLPPGMEVSAPKSQADRTKLDLGYAMPGIG